MSELQDWANKVAGELGLPAAIEQSDVDLILDLARDAAHGVARPAAPLTTYLLGVAVGQGADPVDAAARITALTVTGTSDPS